MNMDPKRNIFNEAAKSSHDASLKKAIEKLPAPPIQKTIPNNPATLSDDDIKYMFNKIQEMRQDLDKKADALKEAISLSRVDVVNFFSNPKNFTPEQWQFIQESREELEKRVWAVVGKDPKEVRKKQKEVKDSKQRKGKMVASRKNWIPIR